MRPDGPPDRSKYEGKNLFRLLLAIGLPALLLYLRVVFEIVGASPLVGHSQATWLHRGSYLLVGLFFALEFLCARYLQRLLRPASTRLGNTAQYAGLFVLCLLFSVTGAIVCEAFGYNFILRVKPL